MDIYAFLRGLEATAFAQFVQQSAWAFPALESAHVIAIALVVGSIAIVDLRLLGLASASRRVTEVARDSLLWVWLAFALAVLTGGLMFVSNAITYFDNFPFRMKMLLLVLAGINMAVFELITFRGVRNWDHGVAVPRAAKLAGFLSLAFWIGAVVFGRWIGFTMYAIPF